MIEQLKDMQLNPDINAIYAMEKSPFNFYPTGSRFFSVSNSTDKSDYDFFVQKSDEVRVFLRSIGLFKLNTSNYMEIKFNDEDDIESINKNNIAEVWGGNILNIHVQLVDDVELKKTLQVILKKYEIMKVLKRTATKDEIRHFWNCMYEIASIDSSSIKETKEVVMEECRKEILKKAKEYAIELSKGNEINVEVPEQVKEMLATLF